MAAQNEVELIVRAKNLSTRTINQLNDELSKIADNQEQVADANRLAERSFESLKSEQQQLLAIMKSLNDRASKLDAYSRQEQQVRSLRDELSRARDNLNTLAQQFYNTEKPTKEFQQQLKSAASEVTRLESSLRNNGCHALLAVAARGQSGAQQLGGAVQALGRQRGTLRRGRQGSAHDAAAGP